MLVYQFECHYESDVAVFSHKSAANSLHDTTLNANFFANDKFTIRLDPLSAEARAQKFDLGMRKRNMLPAVAHDMQHSRRLENLRPLSGVDVYKQVAWEERQDELLPLPVLPDPDGFIGRKKRFNISQVKVFHD